MTRISPVRRAALLVTTLAAGLGGILASAGPGTAAAPQHGVARQAAERTDLTLAIEGCDRCSVQLVHAVDGEADHVWTSHVRRVGSDHEVVFHPRTALTHGLSFVVDAPWAGNTGAVPNMVTRYAGHRIGTAIERADARQARRASGCWAGTGADSARLTFRVDRVGARTVDGHRTKAPLVYSTHTLASWRPYLRTHKGTIANQDALYCTRPTARPTARPTGHAATRATAAAGRRTSVAFLVDGCNRCHVRLYQAVEGREHVWESRTHRVRNGRVSFDIATRHTHGLSASVTAPWEGNTGAVTQIAFRYAHEPVGSDVENREARTKHRASGCWAGTSRTAVLLPLVVRKATITGVDGSPTTAARAWIGTTTDWWKPMLHAYRGILGAQDVVFCERP